MARCPSCQHQVPSLYNSFRLSIVLRNMLRSPANRIFLCKNCGEELTLTFPSFIFCQIVFVVTVIPCAILFARLYVFLTNSMQLFDQVSKAHPALAIVFLWILPTLTVTLSVYTALAGRLVELKRASD